MYASYVINGIRQNRRVMQPIYTQITHIKILIGFLVSLH